jgi:hypothetical protein
MEFSVPQGVVFGVKASGFWDWRVRRASSRYGSARRRLRHEAGVTPVSRLKARQNAASDS